MIYNLPGRTPRLGRDVYLAPTATVVGDVQLGDEVSIWFGAVLRGDVVQGAYTEGRIDRDSVSIERYDSLHKKKI